jgi:hypothetical protein
MTTNKKKRIECKDWFRTNRYEDVVALIEQAEAKMAARGSKQRRNWWEVLAGGANGKPSVREGIEFPVLRAAQIHQGKEITPNAICRNLNEQPPSAWRTGRWPLRKRKTKS